ncbi:MAG TPA: hypothetical protein VIP28_05900 [Nocardioides sp.]
MTTLRELDPAAARELARLGEAVAKLTGQADNDTPSPVPARPNRWKERPPQLDDRVTEEFGDQTGVVVNVDHPGQRAFVTIDGAEGWYDWDDLRPAAPAGALTMPALPFRLAKDGAGRELELDHVDGAYYIQATHRRHGVAVNVDLAEVMRGLSRFMPEGDHVNRLRAVSNVLQGHGIEGTSWSLVEDILAAANPPVTADPAAAPSVEQIAEMLVRHQRIPMYETSGDQRQRCVGCDSLKGETDGPNSPRHAQHLAEEIRALYGTPGDAGEPTPFEEHAAKLAASRLERAESAEARVKELEAEVERRKRLTEEHATANGGCVPANAYNELAEGMTAEVERYKAALEAADLVIEYLVDVLGDPEGGSVAEALRSMRGYAAAALLIMAAEADGSEPR